MNKAPCATMCDSKECARAALLTVVSLLYISA